MVIDASVWVATLLTNDFHHQAALHYYARWCSAGNKRPPLWPAWSEVTDAIARRIGDNALAKAVVAFLDRQAALEYVSSTSACPDASLPS